MEFDMDRREAMKVIAATLAGPSTVDLEAIPLESDGESTLWMIGPPGHGLKRYARCLAIFITDSGWEERGQGIAGSWWHACLASLREPLLFDDLPFQGDNWVTAREKMTYAANNANVRISFLT